MKNNSLPPVFNTLVEEYQRHLVGCAGLAVTTGRYHHHSVRDFLREHRKKLGLQLEFQRLTPHDLLAYVTSKTERCCPVSLQLITATLRSFFKFLSLTGRCQVPLADAVPKVAAGGRRGLPRHLTPEQLQQLLQTFSGQTTADIRDHAVVLCLARLGLRAGEVSGLRLDNIDWRRGTVSLETTKGRRSRQLPLTTEVGRALARYLRAARPPSTHREVFLSLLTPSPLSSQAITYLTAQALRRAGVNCVRPGAHLLRHTFATHLIQRGGEPQSSGRPARSSPTRYDDVLHQGQLAHAGGSRPRVAGGNRMKKIHSLREAITYYLPCRRRLGFALREDGAL